MGIFISFRTLVFRQVLYYEVPLLQSVVSDAQKKFIQSIQVAVLCVVKQVNLV